MAKKVCIIARLSPQASDATNDLIEQTILNDAKIPWCESIDEIVIDDLTEYCKSLQKKGVSSNAVKNLMTHFYQE